VLEPAGVEKGAPLLLLPEFTKGGRSAADGPVSTSSDHFGREGSFRGMARRQPGQARLLPVQTNADGLSTTCQRRDEAHPGQKVEEEGS
jgi:hypothetical protein